MGSDRVEGIHHRGDPVGFLDAQLGGAANRGHPVSEARQQHQQRQLVDQRRHLLGGHIRGHQLGRMHLDVGHRLTAHETAAKQLNRWGGQEIPGNPTRDIVRVVEQCTAGCANNGNIANLTYRSQNWADHWMGTHTWRASASYVTGAQSIKIGYQGGFLVDDQRSVTNTQNLAVPVQQRRAEPDHGESASRFPSASASATTPCMPRNSGRSDG